MLATAAPAGEVQLRVQDGRLDLIATAAPLQEVLARLAQQTGMKVIYDGPAPRSLVTVTLPQRTPAEAVLALLEGLGLNYLLKTDPSGVRVDTLIVSGPAPAAGQPARAATPPPPAAFPGDRRQSRPPVAEEREVEDSSDSEQQPQAPPSPQLPPGMAAPIPGPGRPGSPFGGQIAPLTFPTPAPTPAAAPPGPGLPTPAPTPTPSPTP